MGRATSARRRSVALDVHIHHLRRRLFDARARIRITTIRGVGYVLQELDRANMPILPNQGRDDPDPLKRIIGHCDNLKH